jgi:hypothetical protein
VLISGASAGFNPAPFLLVARVLDEFELAEEICPSFASVAFMAF